MTRLHLTSPIISHGPKVSARIAARKEVHDALREFSRERVEQAVKEAVPMDTKLPWWAN